MRDNQGLKGRRETPRVKEIFQLFVVDQNTITETAELMDQSPQAISAVVNDDFFKELEDHYHEAMETQLSRTQRRNLMRSRAILYDHVEETTRSLLKAAKDPNPSVRGAAVKAQLEILKQTGAFRDKQEDTAGQNMLVIKFDGETVASLKEGGYDVSETLELKNKTHAEHLGKQMGEGIKEEEDPR